MKFSCEKALLQSMITIASRAVAPKSTIPALEGVLLEAEQELNLTGYNLKTGIRGTISADIAEPGSIVLSARLFGDIIRRLPDDMVTLSTDDLMVNITCGMSEFNILGMDPSQFPELPAVEYQNSMILPQRILHSMITETIFAVSTNDSRTVRTKWGRTAHCRSGGRVSLGASSGDHPAERVRNCLPVCHTRTGA